MVERIPGWLERILLPRLSEINGELKAINARIGGLDSKVEGEFKAVHSEIERVDEKVDGVDKRLGAKIDNLDKRLDMAQRLAVLEAKMSELQPKA